DIEARTGAITFGNTAREVSPEAEQIVKLWQAIAAVPRPPPTYALAGRFEPPVAKWEEDEKSERMGRIVVSWVLVAVGFLWLFARPGYAHMSFVVWFAAIVLRAEPPLRKWVERNGKAQRELLLAEQRWEHVKERWKTECSTAAFERTLANLEAARNELVSLSGIGNTEQHRQMLLTRLREGPT